MKSKNFFLNLTNQTLELSLISIVVKIKSLLSRYKRVAALAQRGRASDC